MKKGTLLYEYNTETVTNFMLIDGLISVACFSASTNQRSCFCVTLLILMYTEVGCVLTVFLCKMSVISRAV